VTAAARSLLALHLCVLAACATAAPALPPRPGTAAPRTFSAELGGGWIGNGIAYGMHRDGQSPTGAQPTRAQLTEDLKLLSQRWHFLRMYDASPTAQLVLQVIRDEKLPLAAMLGCWVAPESKRAAGQAPGSGDPHPEGIAANRAELERCVRIANAYPDVVRAIIVGNETQIDWSDHRCGPEVLIRSLREVRARTQVPITTADDHGFWSTEASLPVAAEVDFLDVHAYGMWGGQQLEDALAFTQEKLTAVQRRHPGKLLVLGEFGWATLRSNEGEQAKLIKGKFGEAEQAVFFEQARAWTTREKLVNFWFEAFDENWKGGPHPDEVEKHWGLYRADRTPKQAVKSP
jgi:exo-beta-1,3-glucanase (GH17 family)